MEGGLIEPHGGAAQAPTDAEPSTDGDEKALIQKLDASGALVACDGDTELEPYEGMEFESEEAAKMFYGAYARRLGFRIRISRYTRSRRDNSIISRRIVCSKEGFREDRPVQGLFGGDRRQRQRAVTRVGCKAMITVKKVGAGKWVVTKFVKEHNHGPVPPRKVEVRVVRKEDDSVVGGVVQEPFVGMEFDSEEAAKLYYNAYARQMGFRGRISKYCRSRRDNSIISRQIVCSKEGFREIRVKKEMTEQGRLKRPRVITRIGCKAMIIVKKLSSDKWIVSKFEREHNHALLTPNNAPLLQSHTSDEKGSIASLQGEESTVPNGLLMGAGTRGTSPESLTVLYNQLCYEATRYAHEGATTVETYNVAMSALREAVAKVAAAKRGAVSVAQPALLISGTNQGITVGQGSNSVTTSAKLLHDLQCLNGVERAITGQELMLLQQPISFMLIPSTPLNDSSSVNRSVEAPSVLNVANGQILQTKPDGMNNACSSQGMNTSNPVQPLPAEPSVKGLVANGSVSSGLPSGRKRELQKTDRDAEHDAIPKYQKLEPIGVDQANATPSGSNLSSPRLSEAQMVAIPALPVALYMPVMGSLPETCSAMPVSAHAAEAGAQSHAAPQQPAVASQDSASTPAPPSDHAKPHAGPNPQVHATAIAAGARIVPPEAAASLIKAIEARIRSARASVAQSASPGGCKLLAAEAWSPRPCDDEEGMRAPGSRAHEGSQVKGASSEDLRLRKSVEASKEFDVGVGHSGIANAGERQMELVEAAGGC